MIRVINLNIHQPSSWVTKSNIKQNSNIHMHLITATTYNIQAAKLQNQQKLRAAASRKSPVRPLCCQLNRCSLHYTHTLTTAVHFDALVCARMCNAHAQHDESVTDRARNRAGPGGNPLRPVACANSTGAGGLLGLLSDAESRQPPARVI